MKKIWIRTLSVLLVICTLLSCMSISAFALSWDGSSTGGGGGAGPATVNGFAIRTDGDNVIGYRFSVVNSSGATKNGKVIDVFRDTYYGNYECDNAHKFSTKYNKKQLKDGQNGSYSTSKTSTNCYKESSMGFATALPAASGMATWQANNTNLNKVLSVLSAGTVDTLSYGDKILVEPIFDVRLESTYHAVTVTEMAIYGKHLLGADSDGGASSNAGSWGFISSYTNKHYPNALYTPDGQGLWTGASSLSGRATFYTMINTGYGVGIAYTQNKNTSYTIKFNGNGNTGGSTASMTMTYGTAKNLTANGFTKTGHSFKNWNTKADGTGTSYSNQQSVNNLTSTNGGTVNLYAQWTPNVVDVYYHANGGALNSSTYTLSSNWVSKGGNYFIDKWKYNESYQYGLYDAATFGLYRTGYTFTKWGTETTGGTLWDQNDSTMKATDLNPEVSSKNCYRYLYAQWKPITYTIAFDRNGGSGTMSNMSMTYDVAKNLTTNAFTRTNYHFVGWNTKADGTGTGYYDKQSVKNLSSTQGATITLYAQWAINSYTIAFNGNGSTDGTTSAMTMNFGQTKNLNANGYKRTGYIFTDWNSKANGTGTTYTDQQAVKDLSFTNGATVYMYAQWTPINYNIRFLGNGYTSGSTEGMAMTYDVSKNLTANGYSKTGYHFVGWNTRADGTGTSYRNSQSVKNLTAVNGATVYLYAQWEPNTYYVRFNGNGSTDGTMSYQTFTYDEAQNLKANEFTKDHYTFKGWNRSASGTGTAYADCQSVMNLTAANNAIVNLYAQWEYDPDLDVEKCDVYKGEITNTTNKLGYTTASTFSAYVYEKGYPMKDDQLWYTITFPEEQVDTRVRQIVWIENGGTTERITYSNSGTTFSVQINPKTVSENDSCFYVKARADWVDKNGKVLKYGTAKTFYIPVRPTVHRGPVMLKNAYSQVVATATPTSSTGNVYVGQRVIAGYTYSADNTWTSYNNLYAYMYDWKDGVWSNVKSGTDYSARAALSKTSSHTGSSSLGYIRVPDSSRSKNEMMFILQSHWTSDPSRTAETDTIMIPVIKADVELKDIRLVNEDGYYVDMDHLQAGQNVHVQYLYKNNTNTLIQVEGFKDDRSKISGIFGIPAGGTIAVRGHSFTVPNQRTFTLWGGVYLEGAGLGNTSWESNGTNNEKTVTCHVDHPLHLIPIEPNAKYREGTDVVTSFWLVNNFTDDYIPSNNIRVRFRIYKPNGTLMKTVIKSQVVVPGSDQNLVYFKWTVPVGLNNANITIKADVYEDGEYHNVVSKAYSTMPYSMNQTPDTHFEKNSPGGYRIPTVPSTGINYATWYEYSYSGGSFVKTQYGLGVVGRTDTLTPATGETAVYENGKWTMKSGYGVSLKTRVDLTAGVSGYTRAKAEAYTIPQYFTALYPEYGYSEASNKCTTLERGSVYAELPQFESYGKVHFTPLWYPDGKYTVSILASDCWTPAGMLTVNSVTNTIDISGSAYDDWYVGH